MTRELFWKGNAAYWIAGRIFIFTATTRWSKYSSTDKLLCVGQLPTFWIPLVILQRTFYCWIYLLLKKNLCRLANTFILIEQYKKVAKQNISILTDAIWMFCVCFKSTNVIITSLLWTALVAWHVTTIPAFIMMLFGIAIIIS